MDTFGAPTDKECSPCPTNTGSLAQTTNITGCVCVQGYTGTDGGPCEGRLTCTHTRTHTHTEHTKMYSYSSILLMSYMYVSCLHTQ